MNHDEIFKAICARMMGMPRNEGGLREVFDAGVAAERERCAKVLRECRDLLASFECCSRNNFANLASELVEDIDAAIREAATEPRVAPQPER
jgi:hypothetical protein